MLITKTIPDEGVRILQDAGVEIWMYDGPRDRGHLLHDARQVDGIVSMLTDRIDSELLNAGNRLRGIANFAVGVDNIARDSANRLGILICNTPDVLTDSTAELAWALILAAARRVVEGDRLVREGRFTGWHPMMLRGVELAGKTLGVIGAGRIGCAVARRAPAFGMRTLYWNRTPRPDLERDAQAVRSDLEPLLREADVVSLHCPLTPETRHLLSRERLSLMKSSAILVNTARGPLVDEAALAEMLASRRLAAAGLDVYEREPEVQPGLVGLPNVVLLPHLGSATRDARGRMAALAARGILDVLSGRIPPNLINPEALPARRPAVL